MQFSALHLCWKIHLNIFIIKNTIIMCRGGAGLSITWCRRASTSPIYPHHAYAPCSHVKPSVLSKGKWLQRQGVPEQTRAHAGAPHAFHHRGQGLKLPACVCMSFVLMQVHQMDLPNLTRGQLASCMIGEVWVWCTGALSTAACQNSPH